MELPVGLLAGWRAVIGSATARTRKQVSSILEKKVVFNKIRFLSQYKSGKAQTNFSGRYAFPASHFFGERNNIEYRNQRRIEGGRGPTRHPLSNSMGKVAIY